MSGPGSAAIRACLFTPVYESAVAAILDAEDLERLVHLAEALSASASARAPLQTVPLLSSARSCPLCPNSNKSVACLRASLAQRCHLCHAQRWGLVLKFRIARDILPYEGAADRWTRSWPMAPKAVALGWWGLGWGSPCSPDTRPMPLFYIVADSLRTLLG